MLFMLTDELQRPTKKPRILPGKEIDEKSKKVCLLIYVFLIPCCRFLCILQFYDLKCSLPN